MGKPFISCLVVSRLIPELLTMKLSFFIILFIFSVKCNPVLALEIYKNSRTGDFIVRQEISQTDDIGVIRPVPVDMKILNLLTTNKIKSLEDYAQWLQKNVKYKKDAGGDIWALPEETLQRQYGDCEDYAFLNASVLQVFGYQPKVLGLRTSEIVMGRLLPNHAICLFEKDGYYLLFDNAQLKQTHVSSMQEVTQYLVTNYHCSSISELAAKEALRRPRSAHSI